MKISKICVKRPVATLMVFISLLIMGSIAITKMPRAFLPTLDWPEMWIWIPYPNSSPTYIEKNIIKPIEEMLSTLNNLKKALEKGNTRVTLVYKRTSETEPIATRIINVEIN